MWRPALFLSAPVLAQAVLVLLLLLGIQRVEQPVVQRILAVMAGVLGVAIGTVVASVRAGHGTVVVAGGRPSIALLPLIPVLVLGLPLLAVTLLAAPPASLVSGVLLGTLLVRLSTAVRSLVPSRSVPPRPSVRASVSPISGERFDKFTERSRNILRSAQEEARRFNHNYIGTEHLLLGLVKEKEGLAAKVLAHLSVDVAKVESTVEFIISRGEHETTEAFGLTPRAKRVIELAVAEARHMNHNWIGTEHLLLGLVIEGEGIAAGVLSSLDVTAEKVREGMAKIFFAEGGPEDA